MKNFLGIFRLLLFLIPLSLLASCGTPSSPAASPTKPPTSIPSPATPTKTVFVQTQIPTPTPAPTFTPLPTQTSTPSPTRIPSATPLPLISVDVAPFIPDAPWPRDLEVISLQNWQNLKEVTAYGTGRLSGVVYNPAANELIAISPVGYYRYANPNLLSAEPISNLIGIAPNDTKNSNTLAGYSSDGSRILTQPSDSLSIYNSRSGELIFRKALTADITKPKISPDGRYLFITELDYLSKNAIFSITEIDSGNTIQKEAINQAVYTFSPDGKYALIWREDALLVMNIHELTIKHTLKISDLPIEQGIYTSESWLNQFWGYPWFFKASFAMAPGGEQIAFSFEDEPLNFLDINQNRILWKIESRWFCSDCMAFSPDGTLFAKIDNESLSVYSATDATLLWQRTSPFGWDNLSFANRSDVLVVQGQQSSFWNALTGAQGAWFSGHYGSIRAMAVSQDGRFLSASYADEHIRLVNLKSGLTEKTIDQFAPDIAFAPDGLSLYMPLRGEVVRYFWQTNLRQNIISVYTNQIINSRNGRYLGFNDEFLVYDLLTGEHFLLPSEEFDSRGLINVSDITFSSSADKFVLSNDFGGAELFQFPEELRSWQPETITPIDALNENQFSNQVLFTPDGEYLLIAGGIDLPTDNPLTSYSGMHSSLFRYLAFYRLGTARPLIPEIVWLGQLNNTSGMMDIAVHPDGSIIAVTDERLGRGQTILIDTLQRKILGTWSGRFSQVEFSPDGKFLILGGDDGLIRVLGCLP